MMTLTQKFVAMGTILFIALAMFLFSTILGVVALIGSIPLSLAILRL